MKNLLLSLIIPLVIVQIFPSSFASDIESAADVIYVGGNIITINDEQPSAEALAVKRGKILAVGNRQELEQEHLAASTQVVDLAGKTLLPGFIDAHSHYINSLLVANQAQVYAPPSGPGRDTAAIVNTIKQFAAEQQVPEGELIMAYGYDDTVMPGGRLLNRDDLDEAFPNNPVRVDHVSMHGAVMNSLALEKYGYSADLPTPPGGVIVRKEGTNEPFGLIMETAFLQAMEQTEPMTAEEEISATIAGQLLYAQAGITTAHEGATHFANFKTMQRTADAGVYIIDVIAFPFITDVDKVLAEVPASAWVKYNNRLKIGGVKITIDGSPQGRTALFNTPYLTGGPAGEKEWNGELTFPQETVNGMVKKVYDLGVPLNLHANGDGAIDAFFQAHAFAAANDLTRDRDVTLIHAQFSRKDQLEKYLEYQLRPSFYTLHTYYFANAHIANRGKAQANYTSPMRDAIDLGLRPTNHTDFVVAPLDQMFMLWSAVNRISREGDPIGTDQSVTPIEGLKTMTIWAAEQYGEEDSKGSLEPGKFADMVILDQSPLEVDHLKIKDIKIVQTIKEGQPIFGSLD